MRRTVIFYRTADGKCPIKEFLDSLDGKASQKIAWVLNLLEDLESIPSMSDLKKYIENRKKTDASFREGFDEGYEQFKIGATIRRIRESAGLTQEELADKLNTKKTAVSRIENHAEDIKISTLERVASALGKKLKISIA